MKGLIAGAVLAALGLVGTAHAYTTYVIQQQQAPRVYVVPAPQSRVLVVPRDPLSGTTKMRVHNDSDYPITSIHSSNAQYGSTYRWGSEILPRGSVIPAHTVITVDFGDWSSACIFNVQVTTASGQTHVFGNIEVCHNNDIQIPNERWGG